MRPVGAIFVCFGMFWGSWAVAAADIEHTLHVSHRGFGLLLSGGMVIAAGTNALAGSLAERWGTSTALARAVSLWAVLLVVAAFTPAAAFAVPLVAILAAGGAVDVVMNVAAIAVLVDDPGRLVQLHGLFNAGAAVGALATGTLLHVGLSWRWTWVAVALAAAVMSSRVRRVALPAGDASEHQGLTTAFRVVWRERLVVLAVAFALGTIVEGGIETWGVLSLRERVGSGIVLGAGAAVVAYAIAALARVTLGPLVASRGAGPGVAVGAAVAAVGLTVLAAVDDPVIAAGGLVLAAAGISMCWPLLLAYASAGAGRPGDVVGGVTAIGYLGFVIGPSIVGSVAGAGGLRAGLVVLVVAALLVGAAPAAHRRAAPAVG